jgi:dipeptidyl-peptidase 4
MKPILKFSFLLLFIHSLAQTVGAQKQITLEDICQNNTFAVKRIGGILSMKNGEHYTTLSRNSKTQAIVMYEYKTGNAVDTILKNSWLKAKNSESIPEIEEYQFSTDESKILITSEAEQIYRHSTKENYYIYDRKSKQTTFVSTNGKQMYAEFSPDGKNIGFVRDNNLFVYEIASGKELQITADGKVNAVINGSTDWVYEEEFAFAKAWCWSPDGAKIAYYRFDESNVKEFSMNKYGTLYPTEYKFKYPKAGEDNSKVSIYIFDLKTKSRIQTDLGSDYEYIPRIMWTNAANTLSIQRMNRLQNKLELLFADADNGKTRVILTETSNTYLEISDNLSFLPTTNQFTWSSERDGYNHLYLYDINGKLINQITKGNWEMVKLKGYDEKNKNIFFTSTYTSPADKILCVCKADGSGLKQLYPGSGINDADFNATYTYYILNHSDANHPPYYTLYNTEGLVIRTLEDNTSLQKKTTEYGFTTKEFFKFKTSEGTELNGWMMKPGGDLARDKKYPVLMFVYGGPGSNTALNGWDRDLAWYQMLCQKGYMVVSVDNRGTGGRGKKFRDCTYKQLGKFETEDQVEAAKYLGTLPFVDKDRIGIWGWSYGGYMSSLCIMKGSDIFKMAMAVAPVANWRYYDNIYTERYMALPKDNGNGYDENSPVNHVSKLKGKFLLIHGTGDDNVHFQNSMEMVSALVKENKQFDFFAYPDKAHSLSGVATRLHLYTLMTNFILKNL